MYLHLPSTKYTSTLVQTYHFHSLPISPRSIRRLVYSMAAPSTFVLKVNISCGGCERDIKKVLQKIPGVWPDSTVIDAEQGRVTVSGFVDPQTVIRELRNAGKTAELLVPKAPPAAASNRNLQIVPLPDVDVRNPWGQVVVVDPVRLMANNMAQFLNGIERKKDVVVTRDSFKISFYDDSSGGNRKDGGRSRGSGGGGSRR